MGAGRPAGLPEERPHAPDAHRRSRHGRHPQDHLHPRSPRPRPRHAQGRDGRLDHQVGRATGHLRPAKLPSRPDTGLGQPDLRNMSPLHWGIINALIISAVLWLIIFALVWTLT